MVLTDKSYEMNPPTQYTNVSGIRRDSNPQQGTPMESSLYETSEVTTYEDEDDDENSLRNSRFSMLDCNEEFVDSSILWLDSCEQSSVYVFNPTETSLSSSEEQVAIQQINTEDLIPYSNLELSDLLKQECPPDQLNIEPDGNHLPTLEQHDNFNLNFELNLNPHTARANNNWYYSTVLDKVFVKLDKTFYIDVLYQYNPQIIPKNIRCMIVYSDGISEKVARCNNHLALDSSKDDIEKHSVMRSDNENITYTGNVEGKNVKDRLSVLIPLCSVQPNENNVVKQSISLKFVCQNSCTGRRQTTVIFTLESESHQVLAKRIMHVKVCSCPKRDKNKDEDRYNLKRTANEADLSSLAPPGKRVNKIKIKEELTSEEELAKIFSPDSQLQSKEVSQTKPSNLGSSFTQKSDGTVILTLELPNIAAAEITALNAYNMVAGQKFEDPMNSIMYTKYLKDLEALRRVIGKAGTE